VNKTVSASGIAFDALPMSAVTHSPDGLEILVVGGELEDGEPSNKIQFVSGTVDSVASGSVASAPLVVTNDLRTPRKGHTATWFETQNRSYALVLGGNFDEDPAHLAEIVFKPSGGGIGTAYPTITYTSNTKEVLPMAFHQTALVRMQSCKFVFVTAGGQAAKRNASKDPVFDPPHMTTPLLHLVEVDVCSNDTAVLTLSDQTDVLTSVAGPASVQRSLHSLTPMGDDLLLLGGGVHRFDAPADPDPLCFDDRVTSGCYLADSRVLHVGGSDPSDTFLEFVDVEGLTFSRARFGHNVVLLPDQTALCSGGLVARDDLGDNILSDAEIFNPRRDSEKTQKICAKIAEDASAE
jgi:hypothetical protein